jgi:hypothetical protein
MTSCSQRLRPMSDTVDITVHELMGPQHSAPCFAHILEKCARQHLRLDVIISAKGVSITARRKCHASSDVSLLFHGRWRSHLLPSESTHKHCRLLLPFVFLIDRISFCRVGLIGYSHQDRSVADFIMRNVFASLAQRRSYRCEQSHADGDMRASCKVRGNMMRAYSGVINNYITDPTLSRHDCWDLIFANTHTKILSHGSPLLEKEAENLRHSIDTQSTQEHPEDVLLERFRQLRYQLNSLYLH